MPPPSPDSRAMPGQRLSATIIGGGIAGLSVAWYLEKAAQEDGFDLSTVLVEKERYLGGKIRTVREDGFMFESGPDGFLTRKPWALDLVKKLKLSEEVVYPRTSDAWLLRGGKLHPIPLGLMGPAPSSWRDLWKASFLSWQGKLRASLEPIVRRRTSTELESLGAFLRRRMGAEFTDTLLEPMTAGIYGGNSYEMSLSVLFPMFEAWERRHGSITRGMRESARSVNGRNRSPGAFFSFKAGADRIVRAITEDLGSTTMVTGHKAVTVDLNRNTSSHRYQVTLDNARTLQADVVVLAAPSPDAANLTKSLAPQLERLLAQSQVSAGGSLYMAFHRDAVSHPLDGSGFLAPRSEQRLVSGCTWMSSKWPGRSPDNYVLLRAFLNGSTDRQVLEYSDSELADNVTETLRPLLGLRGAPAHTWVHRWSDGMPQYNVDHSEWLDAVDGELAKYPGLLVCGASYRGIGVPDCIRQARETAERIRTLAVQLH